MRTRISAAERAERRAQAEAEATLIAESIRTKISMALHDAVDTEPRVVLDLLVEKYGAERICEWARTSKR